jgi:transketolase
VPTWDRTKYGKLNGVAKGAYVLVEESRAGHPDVILVATGSEVQLAVRAAERLEKSKISTRVVSMPCREWFEKQSRSYQDKVLPPAVRARVSVEAGVSMGWHDVVGDAGRCVSIEHFGASADQATLFREFGFTPEAVVKAAKDSIKAARGAATKAPGVTETNPARAAQSASTDVMGADAQTGSGNAAEAAAASAPSKGK